MADTNPNKNRLFVFMREVWTNFAGPILLRLESDSTLADVKEACKTWNPGDPDQVKLFWAGYEKSLQSKTYRETLELPNSFIDRALMPWVKMAESGDPNDEKAWKDGAAAARDVLWNCSYYQLKLIRWFFRGPAPLGFDPTQVETAFLEFAKGRWSPSNDSGIARMNDIRGWAQWAAFVDTVLEAPGLGVSRDDREAWVVLQRMVLYGALIHAHHDPRGPPNRRPSLQPEGLLATDEESIRAFALKPNPETRKILIWIHNEIVRTNDP